VSGRNLKKAAALFCGALLGTLIFSAAFIILNVDHDCTRDEYCPLCLQLQAAAGLLKQPGFALARIPGTGGFSGAPAIFPKKCMFCVPPPISISLKIRMNT
jgi:hypothetical protein